jgi:glucose-6-phosphate 1-dehydrogenase
MVNTQKNSQLENTQKTQSQVGDIIGKSAQKKPVILVIFGGTGDLTKRKLVPALAGLVEEGVISTDSLIVGIGRRDYTHETYRNFLLSEVTCKVDHDCVSHANILYYQKDTSLSGSLLELAKILDAHDTKLGVRCERVFYLATSYELFGSILENILEAKLDDGTAKIVFEKPFGHDYKSALKLEKHVHTIFDESRVYRIDHYLGKETVQNIITLRFANPIISAIFCNAYIDHIDVFSDELLDVANRIGYYNTSGATKDMVQSHLLQVLSLILMPEPKSFDAEHIHDAKVKALKSLRLGQTHVVGQYDTYQEELKVHLSAMQNGIKNNLESSQTETFVRMNIISTLKQWRNVQIFLQTGKALDKKSSKIIVYLKQPSILSGFTANKDQKTDNRIVIDIQPGSDIKIYFNTRKPYSKNELIRVPMEFSGEAKFGPNTTDGYKLLLSDVFDADKTLFTRYDELMYSWKLIDSFMKVKEHLPLVIYKKGSSPFVITGNVKW